MFRKLKKFFHNRSSFAYLKFLLYYITLYKEKKIKKEKISGLLVNFESLFSLWGDGTAVRIWEGAAAKP